MLESPSAKFCYDNHHQIRKEHLNSLKTQIRQQITNNYTLHQCIYCKNSLISFHQETQVRQSLSYCLQQQFTICHKHLQNFTSICLPFLLQNSQLINSYLKASNKNLLLTNHIYLTILTAQTDQETFRLIQHEITLNELTKLIYEEGPYTDLIKIQSNTKLAEEMQEALCEKFYQQTILLLMQKFPKTFFKFMTKTRCIDNLISTQNEQIIKITYQILINFFNIVQENSSPIIQDPLRKQFQQKYLQIIQRNLIGKNPQGLRYYEDQYCYLLQQMTANFLIFQSTGKQFMNQLLQWLKDQKYYFDKCDNNSLRQMIRFIANQKQQFQNQQVENTYMMDIQ